MTRFVSALSIAAATILMALTTPAAAQSDIDPDIVAAQTGVWLVAPLDGAKGCRLTFSKDQTIGGYAITGAEHCATALPPLSQSHAWAFSDGGLILIDATRRVLARFEESEGSPWHTVEGRPLALVTPPGTIDRLPTQKTLSGDWILRRPGGEVLCGIKLTAGSNRDENGTMSPAGDCAAAVTRLKLEFWQVNSYDVTLMSGDGASLTFTIRADGNFEKIREEGGKPLLMMRR